MAFSTSPPDSWRAALQSIIPAPVRSRRAFTSLALISAVLTGSLPLRPDLPAAPRPARPAAAAPRAEPPPAERARPPAAGARPLAAEPAPAAGAPPPAAEIGRASCRERGEVAV